MEVQYNTVQYCVNLLAIFLLWGKEYLAKER